jgi:putative ubiquitin-RnfH superfamily antitoxin RatB of RatAB toxin-antitoxin module
MGCMSPISIELVYSPAPGKLHQKVLVLPMGSCVQDALQTSEGQFLLRQNPDLSLEKGIGVGIWGRLVDKTTVLKAGDRLELYRPLTVDPKMARRLRFEAQGRRRAGLFQRS